MSVRSSTRSVIRDAPAMATDGSNVLDAGL
jgi:hypothetical protein